MVRSGGKSRKLEPVQSVSSDLIYLFFIFYIWTHRIEEETQLNCFMNPHLFIYLFILCPPYKSSLRSSAETSRSNVQHIVEEVIFHTNMLDTQKNVNSAGLPPEDVVRRCPRCWSALVSVQGAESHCGLQERLCKSAARRRRLGEREKRKKKNAGPATASAVAVKLLLKKIPFPTESPAQTSRREIQK